MYIYVISIIMFSFCIIRFIIIYYCYLLLFMWLKSNVICPVDAIIIMRATHDNTTCFYRKTETIRYIFRCHSRRDETLRSKSKRGILVAWNQWNVTRRRFNNPACLLIKPVRARDPSVRRARTTPLSFLAEDLSQGRSLISNKRETILSHRPDRIKAISKRTDSFLRRALLKNLRSFYPDSPNLRREIRRISLPRHFEGRSLHLFRIISSIFAKSLNILRLRRHYSVSMLTDIKSNFSSEYIRCIYSDVGRSGHISVRRRVAWKISRMRGGLKSRRRMSATWVDSIRGVGGKRGRATAQVHEGWWHVGLDIAGKKEEAEEEEEVYRQSNLMPLKTTPSSKISCFIRFL